MAFMIPTSPRRLRHATDGERLLFDLFEKRLPDSCIVRYEMVIGERDHLPDYTVIDSKRGILILEVKDWEVDRNIYRAELERFYIRYGGNSIPKPQPNPDWKCQTYLRWARTQLVTMPALRDSADRLAVPVSYLLAFPNISKQEFEQKGLDKFIPMEHVLFREDLGKDGDSFYRRYTQLLPELTSPLNRDQEDAVVQALFTDIVIRPVRDHKEKVFGEKAFAIDPVQEQIAKSLGEGPRLLRGIAGTGKTLIMLYRAKLLAANDTSGELRILVLCWNVSLANYMRQLYDCLQIKTRNDGQVNIMHFAQFAGRFLKRRIEYEEFDDPAFTQSLGDVAVREFDQYDAIYIDEAQDFRREWIQFLFHRLLKGDDPKTRNLLIAADDAQRIYLRRDFSWDDLDTTADVARLYQDGDFSWSKLGIPMQGRTKILKTVYRNSARVWIFAAYLLGEVAVGNSDEAVRFSSKGGYNPDLIECSSPSTQIDKAIEIIKSILASNYAAQSVLILYRHKQFGGFQWADELEHRLTEEHIPCESITENKRYFDWQANTVKISTVHSAKGMDSPVVILLGAEAFVEKFEDQDETKLMYVALTRAREYLVVLYTGNKGLVRKLLYCQKQYSEDLPRIMEHLEKNILN